MFFVRSMAGLDDLLLELGKNPLNKIRKEKDVRHVIHEYILKKDGQEEMIVAPIVSIYTGEKYAEFHDEFTQTALMNPELQPLVKFLNENRYRTNLT